MNHFATPRFWKRYHALPAAVRELADKSFVLLKRDPSHPSLHLKTVGDVVSVRIGLRYRALATPSQGDLLWFWIGSHAEYDTLIGVI